MKKKEEITPKEYEKAMAEMECWSVRTHIKKCAKCQKIYKEYCRFVGVETTDGSYWCETHDKWEKAG